MNVLIWSFEGTMQALRHDEHLGRARISGQSRVPNGSVSDEFVIRALQPFRLLQIGSRRRLFGSCHGEVAVRMVGPLEDALDLLPGEQFDLIVLGSELTDAWPTTAYETLAEVAGSTPIVVTADQAEPILMVRRRQDRANDEIVSSTAPILLLERIVLATVLRTRALAALGAEIG
jgi:DNA-binding NarL/FixJ family response regulator